VQQWHAGSYLDPLQWDNCRCRTRRNGFVLQQKTILFHTRRLRRRLRRLSVWLCDDQMNACWCSQIWTSMRSAWMVGASDLSEVHPSAGLRRITYLETPESGKGGQHAAEVHSDRHQQIAARGRDSRSVVALVAGSTATVQRFGMPRQR
jgi:hypothetical protein